MTEELSQDSLGPQETSKDSGVITEGQLSNPTEENALAQGNQNSQSLTVQNNQNNKKYDLGVLFVHGIGPQMPGETLDAIYPEIKGELMAGESLKYNDTQHASNALAIDATIYNQYDGSNKNITFRESHWNNLSNKTNRKNYMSNGPFLIGFLKACKYILISLLAACVSHVWGLAVFISFVLIASLMVRQNISQVRSFALAFVLTSVVIVVIFACMAWMNKVGIKKINLRTVCAGIKNGLKKIRGLSVKEFWNNLRLCVTSLMWLYQQIDGISGGSSNGTKAQSNPTVTVQNDIQNLVNECDAVTVVAHSMGAYLSVDALQKVQGINKDKLHLITFGSGFAPVSLLREVGQDCRHTTRFILTNILGFLSLVGSVYCSMYTVLHLINGDFSAVISYVFLGVVFGLICCVIHLNTRKQIAKSQAVDIKDKVTWQNHSFVADYVGNSVSSLNSQSDSCIIPVYKPAHTIRSYFKKDSMMCKIVSRNILEMVGAHRLGDSKYVGNFKTFRILYTISAVVIYVIMVLVDLKFKDGWFGYLVLFAPFVVSSIFLLSPRNDSVYSYSQYYYWDKKSDIRLDAPKLYLWSFIFGLFAGMVGFFSLYIVAVWII